MLSKLQPYRAILLNAASIIRERGWCVGEFYDADGHVCTATALNLAATGGDIDAAGKAEAYKRLKDYLGIPIIVWNDAHAKSADEVVAALEHVALLVDA